MNKFIRISLLLFAALMLFSTPNAVAQKRLYPEFHYLSLPISFGYSSFYSPKFKDEVSTFKVPGKVGVTLGLGYEYRYRMFWMSMHLEGQLLTGRLRPGITSIDTLMYDTDVEYSAPDRLNKYTYHISKWHEDQLALYGCFPLMFGIRMNAFYMGIGAKFGYSFHATSTPTFEYSTTSHYDRYYDDFHDMPNHSLTGYEAEYDEASTKFDFNFNVAAIAEIGYEVYHFEGSKRVLPWILKVGAYAEYGVFTAYENKSGEPVDHELTYKLYIDPISQVPTGEYDPSHLVITPYYRAHSTKNVPINPLYVGVKATFLFELPVPQKCHCLQKERGASWRNMAPKQTQKQNKKANKKVRKQKKRQSEEPTNSNLKSSNSIQ